MVFKDKTKIVTPTYAFSKTSIKDCYNSICEKMPGISMFYSLKANAEKEVLLVLKELCSNFEIASVGELEILKEIGIESNKIICGLPVKPVDWLNNMYSYGCMYYVFDTIDELNKLMKFSPNAKKILRININDLLPQCIDFGMNILEIYSLFSCNPTLKDHVDGISFHISNNISVSNFNSVFDRIEQLFEFIYKEGFILNIGGGYRINASDEFFSNLNQHISVLKKQYNISVIAEPGNTIVNSSGKVYTSIIGLKRREHYTDVFIDAGKPSGIKTDKKRIPSSIEVVGKKHSLKQNDYRFIDITCMHKPHFFASINYCLEEGDIIVFSDMGAYTVCLQSKFHLWKSPSIKIVE